MEKYLNAIIEAVYDGDEDETLEAVDAALEAGVSAEDIINKGGVIALEKLGKAFDDMEAFLPDMMLGGECMHALLEKVNPYLQRDGKAESATVVVGCAQGDLHDIGLNLVATQLSVGGYNVINLGTDTTVAKFISTANGRVFGAWCDLRIRDDYKVIVGGGPITPDWTQKIGADGYSRTASLAVELCHRLLAGASDLPVIVE